MKMMRYRAKEYMLLIPMSRWRQSKLFVTIRDWPEDVAEKYAASHKPLYEVEAEIEYDDETNEVRITQMLANGQRFVPA